MEMRQLRYFVEIARLSSFSKAAASVHVAQSALSQQVRQLEMELDAKLLHRLPRGVALTESGLAFLPHAQSILRQADDARSSVAGALDQPSGKVTFGVPPSICGVFALPMLQAVRHELPRVEFELTEELTGSLASQLRAGTLDLAVLLDDGDLGQFRYQALLRERLLLVTRPQTLPAGKAGRISLRRALALPLLLPRARQGVRPILEAMAQKLGLPPPNVVGEINSVSILRPAVMAGIGHTIQAASAFWPDLQSGVLTGLKIQPPDLHRTLALCSSRQLPPSAAAQAVTHVATRVARELVDQGEWPYAAWVES